MLLYRYHGITIDGERKRGAIEAKDKKEAIFKVKNEESIVLIISLKKVVDNPIVNTLRQRIDIQLEKIDKNLEKRKGRKVEHKEKKETSDKKVKRGLSFPISFGKKKVVMDEDLYEEMRSIFKKHGESAMDDAPSTDTIEIEVGENVKPRIREKVKKKESVKEKEINWNLIESQAVDKNLLKKNRKLKVKMREIILLTKRLQIMLSSGVSLVNSLVILEKNPNKVIKYIVGQILNDIHKGSSFSEAIVKYPNQFDQTYVAMVSIGETSGNFESCLEDIIAYKEQREKVMKKLRTASIYPSVIGLVLVLLILVCSFLFIPMFEEMFEDQGLALPSLTRIVFSAVNLAPYIIILLVIFFIVLKILRRRVDSIDRLYRTYFDKLVLTLPLVKNIMKTSYMHIFSSTLSLMLKNGVKLKDALELAQRSIPNIYIRTEILNASSLMVEGLPLSEALSEQKYFDEILTSIILTGEESGKMDRALKEVSNYYESELNRYIEGLMEAIQPVFMLLMGILVGPIIIAVYLPILDISSGALL